MNINSGNAESIALKTYVMAVCRLVRLPVLMRHNDEGLKTFPSMFFNPVLSTVRIIKNKCNRTIN